MLRKALRTAQNYFPGLHQAKNDAYYFARRYLGTVHDSDFRVIRLLPRTAGDLFVDVGANRGQSILAIRKYRPNARIVSFEPNPVIFKELDRRFGNWPGVRLENMGVGAADAELPLFIPAYRGFVYDGIATFSRETALAYLSDETLHFFDPKHVSVSEYRCRITTLDSFELAPTFMKMDIEGYEYEAIQGARETLRLHEPIMLIERFWKDDRVTATLGELGYFEVVERDGKLVRGTSEGINMVLATPRRLLLSG